MRIELSHAAADLIAREAPASIDGNETGGILLGHDHGDTILITIAGSPGPKAVRHPVRFLRDLDHAEQLADGAYEADRSVWVGEWHTHPSGPTLPSPLDLRTYATLLADDDLGFERFAALIVTPCATHGWAELHLTGWTVDREGAQHVQVQSPGAALI